MAVDVLEGLLEEDDEVVQVSSDSVYSAHEAHYSGRGTKKERFASVCVCKAMHNMKVSVFFRFPCYVSVC